MYINIYICTHIYAYTRIYTYFLLVRTTFLQNMCSHHFLQRFHITQFYKIHFPIIPNIFFEYMHIMFSKFQHSRIIPKKNEYEIISLTEMFFKYYASTKHVFASCPTNISRPTILQNVFLLYTTNFYLLYKTYSLFFSIIRNIFLEYIRTKIESATRTVPVCCYSSASPVYMYVYICI